VRALQIVQHAQASNKPLAPSTSEKLLFAQVKAIVAFRNRYEMDIRKHVYQFLRGRGENWWVKNNASALKSM
jgi:hypothetical protein